MAIWLVECHAMAFDSTNCHSSGILRSRMPQLWHSALSNATALAFDKPDCHFYFCRGNLACRMPRAWHSTEQTATPKPTHSRDGTRDSAKILKFEDGVLYYKVDKQL
jgi:hypothetical protein